MTNKSTVAFNKMYGLPVLEVPGFPAEYQERHDFTARLSELRKILLDEVNEVDDIVVAFAQLSSPQLTPAEWSARTKKITTLTGSTAPSLNALVMLADWLGDLRVYCESEMIKFGLDSDKIHEIIMGSNETKLGEDGMPIIKDGKVQKGPNFVPPEGMIAAYIRGYVSSTRKHGLYTAEDADKPDAIWDSNGEVVLSQCKLCGKAEVELQRACDAN